MNDTNLSEPRDAQEEHAAQEQDAAQEAHEPNSASIVTLSLKEYDELKDKIYSLKNDLSRLKQKNKELSEENRKLGFKIGLLVGQAVAQGIVLKDPDQMGKDLD